jgi:hypothetical protein
MIGRQDLHSIMFDIRSHVPRTIAGVLTLARASAAYEEAPKDSYNGGQRGGGMVLGRELADAVLRIAGAAKKVTANPLRPWDGDVAGDARNLSHLIDALSDAIQEVKRDGSDNEELDRASALAWIARDLAEELMINTSK